MGNKITLGLLKQLIREELNVLKKGKIRLNEQDGDGYTFYEFRKQGQGGFKIAVKGNEIFLIESPDGVNFKIGKKIGGGSAEDFKLAVDLKNKTVLPGKHNYDIGNSLINKMGGLVAVSDQTGGVPAVFGFVIGTDNIPKIYIGGIINKKGVLSITPLPASPMRQIGSPFSQLSNIEREKEIPPPETPKEIPEIASFNANFNFNSATLANNEEFDKQLTKYLEGFIYLKKHEPLKLIVATSASIDTPNVSRDYELTQERAKAVAVKIGEITRNNPRIPKFTVMQMPLGQTDRFAKGVKAPKYNRDQTAVNRKVLVGTVDKITTFLNNYPGEISTGKPK